MRMSDKTNINFMFWNIHKNEDAFPFIAEAIRQYEVDIFVLAEMPDNINYRLQAQIPDGYDFQELSTDKAKVRFVHSSRVFMSVIGDVPLGRGTMLSVRVDGADPFNLVGCHLFDPINNDPRDNYNFARDFSIFIRKNEVLLDNHKTIVIGDFNMNPFEDGMAAAYGFNAVMDKQIALRGCRTHKEVEYPFFFNPMWFFLGHPTHVNGTIYHNDGKGVVYYWNIYDQVLIRPQLIGDFNHDDLKIVTQIGDANLLTKNHIVNKEVSDHLPLFLTLKI